MDSEKFKVINGFPDYKISSFGYVYYKDRTTPSYMSIGSHGYYSIILTSKEISKQFCIHRLVAEAFIPNEANKPIVDHIDNDKLNNNIHNLRWASYAENNWNLSLAKNNSTGVKGVKINKRYGSYIAYITYNKRKIYIGSFKTLEEAKQARQQKANELFGQFVNKCEKVKTEIEELFELEREFEALIRQ